MRHFEHDEDLFGIGFIVLFTGLYIITVNKVTLVGFTGANTPSGSTTDKNACCVNKLRYNVGLQT